MSGVGVLGDRHPRSPSLDFRRFNLIYGFNGSGKSTLSRMFASLARGGRDPRLPASCTFEFEFDDGALVSHHNAMGGAERRLAIFNADFLEENLQWAAGRAKPVFHIGRQQAEKAAELARREADLPGAEQTLAIRSEAVSGTERAFAMYKRERARTVAEALRLRTRKYEAPQLAQDHARADWSGSTPLSNEALDATVEICRADEPMRGLAARDHVRIEGATIERAWRLLETTPAARLLDDLLPHPGMVVWVKQGRDYHEAHDLGSCLLCGGPMSPERRAELRAALNDGLKGFLDDVDAARTACRDVLTELSAGRSALPDAQALSPDLRSEYGRLRGELLAAMSSVDAAFRDATDALDRKRLEPTNAMPRPTGAGEAEVAAAIERLSAGTAALDALVGAHNAQVDQFSRRHEEAVLSVRRHFVALGREEVLRQEREIEHAVVARTTSETAVTALRGEIAALRSAVREHGPASGLINALIRSYLGHDELTICAIEDGYEIHRHGRPIEGLPSEGEKTAIALCYFLTTLEADGRSLRDLIVVVDDPISSLDTKALNYACAMVRNRVAEAAQLFVLTHNQNCMNEFKKAWRRKAEDPENAGVATAKLLFLDVTMPKGKGARSTEIVAMSRLIREYDSEYHFLFRHLLAFEASTDPDYEYAYMMPNVLRRVLDVFLAFRCPGSSGLAQKVQQLCGQHLTLDRDRMVALDRLVQVESHSESLDDLIGFSSMTLEETRGANAALLDMMEKVDPEHLRGLRRLCR